MQEALRRKRERLQAESPEEEKGLQELAGEGLPLRMSGSVENGFDTQVRGAVCLGHCSAGKGEYFFEGGS